MADEQSTVEYRQLPQFPGYKFGSDGSVWSCLKPTSSGAVQTQVWRAMKGAVDRDGYRKLILCVGGRRHYVRAHAVVLLAFSGPAPRVGMVAAHDNGDSTDNRIGNLFWKTQKENIADKSRHGTKMFGEKHVAAKLTDEKVAEIRRGRRAGEKLKALAVRFGVSKATIEGICKGRTWGHLLAEG
jgi:hypothetical protein